MKIKCLVQIHITMAHTRTSTFNYQSNRSSSDAHYEVTIVVKDLLYSDGKEYMDISYDFKTVGGKQSIGWLVMNHPFYGSQVEDFLSYEGEVIAKNPMTELMVEYLLMDDAELAKFTGHTTPQDYKRQIMVSIPYFWD